MPNATHILKHYDSQNYTAMFRADDGILIAIFKDEAIVFGEEPNKRQSRVFLSTEYARKWLRETYSRMDLKDRGIEGDPVIEEIQAEGQVILPKGSMDLPKFGELRPFKN